MTYSLKKISMNVYRNLSQRSKFEIGKKCKHKVGHRTSIALLLDHEKIAIFGMKIRNRSGIYLICKRFRAYPYEVVFVILNICPKHPENNIAFKHILHVFI